MIRWARRSTLALSLFIGAFLTLYTISSQPATAVVVLDVATEEAQVAALPSQSLTVDAAVAAPSAEREDFTVSLFTVVQWPVARHTVSSGFGWRTAPCSWGCSSDHQGVDLDAGGGNPVWAVADGVVTQASCGGGLGCSVTIRHTQVEDGSRFDTVYGHMQYGSITVGVGDKIDRGTTLGRVGSTGASTGNHLHFEVRPGGGGAVDPLAWLARNVNI